VVVKFEVELFIFKNVYHFTKILCLRWQVVLIAFFLAL
jgi:hypothetical protein